MVKKKRFVLNLIAFIVLNFLLYTFDSFSDFDSFKFDGKLLVKVLCTTSLIVLITFLLN